MKSPTGLNLSMEISEFQGLIKELYHHRDKQRGKEHTLLWLVEEVGELAEAVRQDNKDGIKEELADVFAWTCSLATLFGLNMDELARAKYPGVCSYCGSKPCTCKKA